MVRVEHEKQRALWVHPVNADAQQRPREVVGRPAAHDGRSNTLKVVDNARLRLRCPGLAATGQIEDAVVGVAAVLEVVPNFHRADPLMTANEGPRPLATLVQRLLDRQQRGLAICAWDQEVSSLGDVFFRILPRLLHPTRCGR